MPWFISYIIQHKRAVDTHTNTNKLIDAKYIQESHFSLLPCASPRHDSTDLAVTVTLTLALTVAMAVAVAVAVTVTVAHFPLLRLPDPLLSLLLAWSLFWPSVLDRAAARAAAAAAA